MANLEFQLKVNLVKKTVRMKLNDICESSFQAYFATQKPESMLLMNHTLANVYVILFINKLLYIHNVCSF